MRAPGEAMGQGDVPGEGGPGLGPAEELGPAVPLPSSPLPLLSQGASHSLQEAHDQQILLPADREGSKAACVPSSTLQKPLLETYSQVNVFTLLI